MWRRTSLAVVLLASVGCGGGGGDGPPASAPERTVVLRDADSGLRITAPRGFTLTVRDGVYVLARGDERMSFSRAITDASPGAYGRQLLAQLGGDVVRRDASGKRFVAEVDRGSSRETAVITRDGDGLAITTATSEREHPLDLATVRAVGASARGGIALKPPREPAGIELEPYRAPDGGASAMVPKGWAVDGGNGSIQGQSEDGAFLLGYSLNVVLPDQAPAGTPESIVVAPFAPAADALRDVFPKLAPTVSDIEVTKVLRDAPLPTFTSSGMYLIDYRSNGEPWTGIVLIGTDSPEKYSGIAWQMYYSGFGVRKGSDGAVGAALLKVWSSWDPSGAIAQRASQAKQLLDDTAAMWQDVSEFRQRTADRQSRDVGCLLQGYYDVEDNSRKYDLPPLPCGQTYVP